MPHPELAKNIHRGLPERLFESAHKRRATQTGRGRKRKHGMCRRRSRSHVREGPGKLRIAEQRKPLHPELLRDQRAAKQSGQDEFQQTSCHDTRADLLSDELVESLFELVVEAILFIEPLDDWGVQ